MPITPAPVAGQLILATWGVAVTNQLNNIDSAWSAYSPTIGGAGWALGNGTLIGAYKQNGKTVYARGRLTGGTTTTYGGSQLTMALPAASHAGHYQLGKAMIIGAAVCLGACITVASSTLLFYGITSAAGALGSLVQNNPTALTTGSTIQFAIVYEAA